MIKIYSCNIDTLVFYVIHYVYQSAMPTIKVEPISFPSKAI